ncbi:MAG: class I SAM-dependent methyltransferase [bacterium]
MYYANKINVIKKIFNTDDVKLSDQDITVNGKTYSIINDVIILDQPEKYSKFVRGKIGFKNPLERQDKNFAKDIQYTFGSEWTEYSEILSEHKKEFEQYFDLVGTDSLNDKTVCDLGCGNGRWSYFLRNRCKNIILIDFSDAIFVARSNLADVDNALFFMCDIKSLPFKDNFADFLYCIGVLHHLPTNCLHEIIKLRRFASDFLIYLYYALDNRPFYFRFFLKIITVIRLVLSKIKNKGFRRCFSFFGAIFIYIPLIYFGKFMNLFKLGKFVPLYESYNDKSVNRIEQDVYDRFFTRIEQRVSRKEIMQLKENFKELIISENEPYWHFICKK